MKFIIDDGKVGTIKAKQATVQHCYNDSLKISGKRKRLEEGRKPPLSDKVLMIELDAQVQREMLRLEPEGELKEV